MAALVRQSAAPAIKSRPFLIFAGLLEVPAVAHCKANRTRRAKGDDAICADQATARTAILIKFT
jgi:hypothetical protein